MKKLLLTIGLFFGLTTCALAQCNGVFPAHTLCGNNSAATNIPGQFPASALTSLVGGTNGQVQYNNSGVFGGFTPGGDLTFANPNFTINSNAVTNSKLATMPANTVKGNATGGVAIPTDVTAASARTSSLLNIDQYTAHGDSIYTILSTDRTVGTNAVLTAPRIWTLPAASSVNAGQTIMVVDYAIGVTAANTLTVQRAGADTIVGGTTSTTAVISTPGGQFEFRSDGVSKWAVSTALVASNLSIKTPVDYGAVCDGATDDSIAIQAWLDGIKNYAYVGWGLTGKTCLFGNNTNFAAKGLMALHSKSIIYGNYMTLKLMNSAAGAGNAGMTWYNGAGSPDQVTGADYTDVYQLIIDGNRANQTNTLASGAMFYVIGSTHVTLRDVQALNSRGDGIYIGGDSVSATNTTFFRVDNVYVNNAFRNGMSVVGATRGLITGGYFNSNTNTVNSGPQCGVDFEPNGSTTQNSNITMIGASAVANGGTLSTTGGSGFCVFNSAANTTNLVFRDLTASSNQRYGFDMFASGGPANVRLSGMSGTSNGTALVDTANVVDWFPTGIVKNTANSCGTGFSCVGVPN